MCTCHIARSGGFVHIFKKLLSFLVEKKRPYANIMTLLSNSISTFIMQLKDLTYFKKATKVKRRKSAELSEDKETFKELRGKAGESCL